MQSELIDASHLVSETETTWGKRQRKIKQIFFNNLGALEGAALDAYPQLRREDVNRIMRHLRKRMEIYVGRSDRFLKWAIRFVKIEARLVKNERWRNQFFESVYADGRCRSAIMNGVREGLAGPTIDAAIEEQDVYNEVLFLVFCMADEMAKSSSTANIRTRLRALAKRHTLDYHTKRRNRKHRTLAKFIDSGGKLGCEFLTVAELASMRADESDDA